MSALKTCTCNGGKVRESSNLGARTGERRKESWVETDLLEDLLGSVGGGQVGSDGAEGGRFLFEVLDLGGWKEKAWRDRARRSVTPV